MKLTLEMKVQLIASASKGTEPTVPPGSHPSSLETGLKTLIDSSYNREFSSESQDCPHQGFWRRIRKIKTILTRPPRYSEGPQMSYEASQIDSTLVGQGVKYSRVSELSCETNLVGSHTSECKFTSAVGEMSSYSQPVVELYSPPPESGDESCRLDGGHPWYGAHESYAYSAPSFNTSDTPIAELPGDEGQFYTLPSPVGAHLPHSSWLQHGIECPITPDNNHDSLTPAQPPECRVHTLDMAVMCRQSVVPNLSPQTVSQQSWPNSPETPVVHGNSSLSCHTALSPSESPTLLVYHALSEEPFTGKSTVDPASLDLTIDTLNNLGLPTSTTQWFADDQFHVNNQGVWSQRLPLPFYPNVQQQRDLSGHYNNAPVFHTVQEPEIDATSPRPGVQHALASPSYLSLPEQSPRSYFHNKTGTWQMNADGSWTACKKDALAPKACEAANHEYEDAAEAISLPEQDRSDTPPVAVLSRSQATYRPAECEYCDRQFTGRYAKGNRRRHINQEHGGAAGKISCRYCEKVYRRSDARHTHEQKKHPQSRNVTSMTIFS
ncbi:hypothetical protein OPT61_g2297 [Boeremia exigua]|uniref:Uncharacterized protein n=1 Tax=Boeremia exigua TaxID=749465 RepID=A0ACC2IM13_9PLEO|nr:hypothetical protein OPT61_g2297 [Boeremia exigua]